MKTMRAAMSVEVNKDIHRLQEWGDRGEIPLTAFRRKRIAYAKQGDHGEVIEMLPKERNNSLYAKVRMSDGTIKTFKSTSLTIL